MRAVTAPALQRARGEVRVGFAQRGGRARLSDLYMSGSAKVLLPRSHTPEPQAVLLNTAGGLTGGDVFSYAVDVGDGVTATVATQTAERIYRASADTARLAVTLRLGKGARLDWLPQETIAFQGSALRRRIDVEMAQDARLLMAEMLVLGRRAMGEVVSQTHIDDQWRIRRGGALLHAEALRLVPEALAQPGTAGLNGADALATLLYVGPDADARLPQVRAMPAADGVRRAASAWQGRLVVRYLARAAQPLRQTLSDDLTMMRGSELPRVWTL